LGELLGVFEGFFIRLVEEGGGRLRQGPVARLARYSERDSPQFFRGGALLMAYYLERGCCGRSGASDYMRDNKPRPLARTYLVAGKRFV
jgi:hypothetical protein